MAYGGLKDPAPAKIDIPIMSGSILLIHPAAKHPRDKPYTACFEKYLCHTIRQPNTNALSQNAKHGTQSSNS